MEVARRYQLGVGCTVFGLFLVLLAGVLSPAGDLVAAAVWELAAAVLAVAIYVVLRRRARRAA
jgi:drug/metabolite transporter (DMT)-like permease